MTTKEKWEWNLKTGTLIVIPCVAASIVADIIAGKPTVSLITNAIIAAVSSSFAVFLLRCWQKRRQ